MKPYTSIYYWRGRAWIAETILSICFDSKTRNRAEHIRGLEQKIKYQAGEIRNMQLSAEANNTRAKAMNILVACDGPCNAHYMDDPSLVTQEVVDSVNRNAERFNHWWNRGAEAGAEAYRDKFRVKPEDK